MCSNAVKKSARLSLSALHDARCVRECVCVCARAVGGACTRGFAHRRIACIKTCGARHAFSKPKAEETSCGRCLEEPLREAALLLEGEPPSLPSTRRSALQAHARSRRLVHEPGYDDGGARRGIQQRLGGIWREYDHVRGTKAMHRSLERTGQARPGPRRRGLAGLPSLCPAPEALAHTDKMQAHRTRTGTCGAFPMRAREPLVLSGAAAELPREALELVGGHEGVVAASRPTAGTTELKDVTTNRVKVTPRDPLLAYKRHCGVKCALAELRKAVPNMSIPSPDHRRRNGLPCTCT